MSFQAGALLQTTRNKILINKPFPAEKTVIADNQTVYIPTEIDGPTIYSFHNGLEIGAGSVFTPNNRCKGMVLVVKHKLILNGKISMTARGAYAPGDALAIDYKKGEILVNPENISNYDWTVGAAGGSGAARRSGSSGSYYNVAGINGTAGINGACGGGGSGALLLFNCSNYSGAGAPGTSYSGGGGGGGSSVHQNSTGAAGATANGGPGGYGRAVWNGSHPRGGGGGAGNPGGSSASSGGGTSYAGSSGTGGLLVLLVYGDLEIGSTGIIEANGSVGGLSSASSEKAGGGGSGGGSITILYTGNLINNGTIQANGGAGGHGDRVGGSGGAGSIRIAKISI